MPNLADLLTTTAEIRPGAVAIKRDERELTYAALDAATARVVPSEAQRKANSERSAGLRDLVRREVWIELK